MKTKVIEVEEPVPGFWCKFMIGVFTDEWGHRPVVDAPEYEATSLLRQLGWSRDHYLILDLESGQGAIFHRGSHPEWDERTKGLSRNPMLVPLWKWLQTQDLDRIQDFPDKVTLEGPMSRERQKRGI